MVPIRAKIDGETQSVMVVRAPVKVPDKILVRKGTTDAGRDYFETYEVTGVDESGGEKRWHLKSHATDK